MGKKPKKEKVRYYDDGRTLADMSGVSSPGMTGKRLPYRSSAKERWDTYWKAVKMMFVPMLVVIGAICVIYMVLYVYFTLFAH